MFSGLREIGVVCHVEMLYWYVWLGLGTHGHLSGNVRFTFSLSAVGR